MKIAGTRFQFRSKLSKTGTNPLFSSWKCMTPHIPFTVANNTCLWVVKIRLPLAHFLTPQTQPIPPQPKSPQIFLTNLENPPKCFDSPISSNLLKWDKMIEYSPQKTINKFLRILLKYLKWDKLIEYFFQKQFTNFFELSYLQFESTN